MVKHTQTIRRPQLTNCFSVFDDFVALTRKGLIHKPYKDPKLLKKAGRVGSLGVDFNHCHLITLFSMLNKTIDWTSKATLTKEK